METETPRPVSGAQDDAPEVVDRRTAVAGEEPQADETDEAPEAGEWAEPEPEDEPGMQIPPEVLDLLAPPSVDVAATHAVEWFARLAWEHLGLVPGARTGQIATDLAEAGRAIDAADFLVKLLHAHLSPDRRRDLDHLVADLKVNYVQKQR